MKKANHKVFKKHSHNVEGLLNQAEFDKISLCKTRYRITKFVYCAVSAVGASGIIFEDPPPLLPTGPI